MSTTASKPFKSLDLEDLDLEDFQPKAAPLPQTEPEPAAVKTAALAKRPEKKAAPLQTVFPSREPTQPKYQQVNMHIRSDVAERFKALAVRDQYTTWKYGQIIEFLLDHYEKTS